MPVGVLSSNETLILPASNAVHNDDASLPKSSDFGEATE
jgi:hypothetical protein